MLLEKLVDLALEEDIGPGDITTLACVPAHLEGGARIVTRQDLVLAGQEVAEAVFRARGSKYRACAADGDNLGVGSTVGEITGPLRSILMTERVALNFLMELSGIASTTRLHVEAAAGAFAVVDTRKTTPLHRSLQKAAVRAGGARNHRFSLFDGVLVKDNHIRAVGSITEAVHRVRSRAHHLMRIQVEVRNVAEGREALAAGADALLLDNMGTSALRHALAVFKGKVLLEASGNMTPERLAMLASTGPRPDLVSVGGLVHQARWVDLSLELTAVP